MCRLTSLLFHKHSFTKPYAASVHGIHYNFGSIVAASRLLGLSQQQALLDSEHPLCLEYPAAPGGGIVRLFPSKGVSAGCAAQVFSKQQDKDSETAKFLFALGEFKLFVLRRTSFGLSWLMILCWQAASRNGGWKVTT